MDLAELGLDEELAGGGAGDDGDAVVHGDNEPAWSARESLAALQSAQEVHPLALASALALALALTPRRRSCRLWPWRAR